LRANRLREGEARRDDQCVVGVSGDRVLLGELRGHFGSVGIGPSHEQHRPRAVLHRGLAVLAGILVERRLQLRVNRTLAAVVHDHDIEGLVELVEDDLVVGGERIGRHAAGLEVRLHVMPVEARAADRHGRAPVLAAVLRIGRGDQPTDVAVHAVVEVEKTVADVENGLGLCDPGVFHLRARLRERLAAAGPGEEQRNER